LGKPRVNRLDSIFFVNTGAFDNSPRVVLFLRRVEKANPRLQINLLFIYFGPDVVIRVASAEGSVPIHPAPGPTHFLGQPP